MNFVNARCIDPGTFYFMASNDYNQSIGLQVCLGSARWIYLMFGRFLNGFVDPDESLDEEIGGDGDGEN